MNQKSYSKIMKSSTENWWPRHWIIHVKFFLTSSIRRFIVSFSATGKCFPWNHDSSNGVLNGINRVPGIWSPIFLYRLHLKNIKYKNLDTKIAEEYLRRYEWICESLKIGKGYFRTVAKNRFGESTPKFNQYPINFKNRK